VAESDFVELIKLVGGIAGLLTAAFTIYDRAIRTKPVVNLVAVKEWSGLRGTIFLKIKNPAAQDIINYEARRRRIVYTEVAK
jgi:hypothetical protein